MRTVRFLLLMVITAISLKGAGFAHQSSSASQQAPSQDGDEATEQRINNVHNGTEARPWEVNQNQKQPARQRRNTTTRRQSVSTSKAAPRRAARPDKRPSTNSLRTGGMGGGTGSKTVTVFSGKAASHRSPPGPPLAFSVNGQYFRNSRDPGARLAVSGGPLTAARNAGAINGTNMRRRP